MIGSQSTFSDLGDGMATGGYALQDSPIVTNDGWSVGQTAAHEQVLNVVPIQVVMLGAIEHEPSNVGVGDSDKLVVAEFDEWLAGRDEAAASIRHGAAGLGQYPSKHSSCGTNSTKVKQACSSPTSMPMDSKGAKAGMSSYKNSSAVVDHQPLRGK
ncbi:hypothetical protein V6N11_076949 [Hibiscus sabdariffa]|uniref:Uncharacterized protein n=1 Tax=Hibiscus sabdariffa TaxID=183260 RepID=A0ABR2TCE1_9ROSI